MHELGADSEKGSATAYIFFRYSLQNSGSNDDKGKA